MWDNKDWQEDETVEELLRILPIMDEELPILDSEERV